MMNPTKLNVVTNPSIKEVAFAASLESPQDSKFYSGNEVLIKGWILSRNETDPNPKVVIEHDNNITEVPLSVRRLDVVSRILKKEKDRRLYCGFRLTLPRFAEGKIYIQGENTRVLWKQIAFSDVDAGFVRRIDFSILEVLAGSGCIPETVDPKDVEHIKKCDVNYISSELQESVDLNSYSGLIATTPAEEKSSVQSFFAHLFDENSIAEWVARAVSNNELSVPNPFGAGVSRSSFSVILDQKYNLLFFDGGSEPFVVVQHVTFADAVFFPKRKIGVKLQHVNHAAFFNSLAKCLLWILNNPRNHSFSMRFGGGIAGHGRPYHAIYDGLSGLKKLDNKGYLQNIPKIYHFEQTCFVDPQDLFPKSPKVEIISPNQLRRRSLDRGEFYFHLGLPFRRITQELNADLDRTMRAAALRKHPGYSVSEGSKVLRIWWGVTAEKRCWVEQEEGSAWILDQLAEEWPLLEVVFDGWTSPIDPKEGDIREIAADTAVKERILSHMRLPIRSKSVIGASSLEKIAIGMSCNAFVANYGTASMHVSRFARRPGVVHNNTMMTKGFHIQHRAVTVPVSRTRDLVEDGKRADFLSYSIEPADILFLLRSVIETRNV